MTAPNCYDCIWRRALPGDAHSACANPFPNHAADTLAKVLAIVMLEGGLETRPFSIRFNRRGIDNGWVLYPINFDPVWLEACTGFTAKETVQ